MAARARTAERRQQVATSRLGRPRDPRRDDAILDAVVELLRDAGSGRVGMREVAERSGTSLATIYRRWPSREDMLLDALARVITEGAPVPDTGDLRGDLLAVIDAIRRGRKAFLESLPGIFAEGAANPQFWTAVRSRLLGVADQALRTVLRRARANGQVAPGADLRLAADATIALFMRQVIVHGRPPPRSYATRIVDHALLPMLGLGLPQAPPKQDPASGGAPAPPNLEATAST